MFLTKLVDFENLYFFIKGFYRPKNSFWFLKKSRKQDKKWFFLHFLMLLVKKPLKNKQNHKNRTKPNQENQTEPNQKYLFGLVRNGLVLFGFSKSKPNQTIFLLKCSPCYEWSYYLNKKNFLQKKPNRTKPNRTKNHKPNTTLVITRPIFRVIPFLKRCHF